MFKSIGWESRGLLKSTINGVREGVFSALYCLSLMLYCFAPNVAAQKPTPSLLSTSTPEPSSTQLSSTQSTSTQSSSAKAPTRYTFLGPDNDGYTFKLLQLALAKTVDDDGEFTLDVTRPMNEARALKSMASKYYDKPIRRFESTPETMQHPMLRTVPFPVYLGVFSYRKCVINTTINAAFSQATSVEMLKPFSFGIVQGWRDGEIFRKNQLKVRPSVSRRSVYQLVNTGRVDTFCRAITELPWEASYFEDLENVEINQSIVLYYLMPFFFSTHVDDTDLANRIYKGLKRAYADGSLKLLWNEYHDRDFVEQTLQGKHVITLDSLIGDELAKEISPYILKAREDSKNLKHRASESE